MPLRALLHELDFFSDELTEENRKEGFKCPNCPSPLIPVLPNQDIIKHFRHKTGHAHYEPESKEHLAGKYEILRIAQSLGFEATTEYRIDDRITDVYVETPKRLAIEFQCSKCNSKEITERTLDYYTNNVATIWILGRKFQEIDKPESNMWSRHMKYCKIEQKIDDLHTHRLIYYNYLNKKFYIERTNRWEYNGNDYTSYNYNEYNLGFHIKKLGGVLDAS